MKPGKVLCYRIFFFFLGGGGFDRAKNLTKYYRWLRVLIKPTNRNIAIT